MTNNIIDFSKKKLEKERKEYEKDLNCPSCASKYYNTIIGRTSFSLLGKGWYKDGYNTK